MFTHSLRYSRIGIKTNNIGGGKLRPLFKINHPPTKTNHDESKYHPRHHERKRSKDYAGHRKSGLPTDRNWRRRNVWESSAASKDAKNSRDKLIGRAYLNAAAKHLTAKAKAINEFLSVRPIHEAFCMTLEYNSPAVGMSLQIASPFCVEAFLNNPEQVLEKLNA